MVTLDSNMPKVSQQIQGLVLTSTDLVLSQAIIMERKINLM